LQALNKQLNLAHTQDTAVTSIMPGDTNVIDVTAGATHAVSFLRNYPSYVVLGTFEKLILVLLFCAF
jgi:hypothetical protein